MTGPAPFLAHLRRSRFGWWLCALVLVMKMASATGCLTDGPRAVPVDGLVATVVVAASVSVDEGAGGCILGEGAGCHCACAHAVPMTFASTLDAIHTAGPFGAPPTSSGFIAPFSGSLFRPPIA